MPDVQPPPDLLHRRFAPLRLVAEKLTTSTVPADAFFDPDDFMLMNWCRDDCPSHLLLFKHVDTRRYINLNARGAAYRYDPPTADDLEDAGRYVPHESFRDAVDHLGLWELPWLRPDLAAHRQGLSWDDRWDRYEDLAGRGLDQAS